MEDERVGVIDAGNSPYAGPALMEAYLVFYRRFHSFPHRSSQIFTPSYCMHSPVLFKKTILAEVKYFSKMTDERGRG